MRMMGNLWLQQNPGMQSQINNAMNWVNNLKGGNVNGVGVLNQLTSNMTPEQLGQFKQIAIQSGVTEQQLNSVLK